MTYRLKKDGETIFPFNKETLRVVYPNVSFPLDISDSVAAEYNCMSVSVPPQPQINEATHKVLLTISEDDVASWDIIELSEQEKLDYYAQTHPPRWLEFATSLAASQEINGFISNVMQTSPAIGLSLGIALDRASNGDLQLFLQVWKSLQQAGLITKLVEKTMANLAAHHDLPAEFIRELL